MNKVSLYAKNDKSGGFNASLIKVLNFSEIITPRSGNISLASEKVKPWPKVLE